MNSEEIRSVLSKAAESLVEAMERTKTSAHTAVDEATEAGQEGVQSIKDKANAALSDTEKKAAELAEEAKRRAAATAGEAKAVAQDQAQHSKQMIGERLEQVADILHSTSKELRSNNEEKLGAYAETAARFFDQAAFRFKPDKKRGVMGFLQEHPEVVAVAILAVSGYLGKRYLSGSKQ